MARFMDWLRQERGLSFSSYEEMRAWSVADIRAFWAAIWDYFGIASTTPYEEVLDTDRMPGGKWFAGARVNYAEHLLRAGEGRDDETAIFFASERADLARMGWGELSGRVRKLAVRLREMGIVPGDRVVSYMPNTPETIIAFLATASVGAIWSSASPEFGVKTVIDRFAQIEPALLFVCDGYRFNGKDYSRAGEAAELVARLPSLRHVVCASVLGTGLGSGAAAPVPGALAWDSLFEGDEVPAEEFRFEPVEAGHPLWILYSSGTTGLPKAIVQSHVGIVLEHYKLVCLHMGLGPDKVMFFYTTTGWMMWNVLVSSLLSGAAIVLYDGSPVWPDNDRLWALAQDAGVTYFGASASYLQMMRQSGMVPKERFDLKIEATLSGGSPVGPELFQWFYDNVSRDCWFSSQSGGTETCSCLVTAVPMQPVYAGEIQARGLGFDLHAWDDDGKPVFDEPGELVITAPFPSMPVSFWNDPDGQRYHEAYFDVYPGVWRHGDLIRINGRGGCYLIGRADSTLNRHGVRIGASEVYQALDGLDGVADSIVVCCELPRGQFFMPLLVALKPGAVLDGALRAKIVDRLRRDASPRHVPDDIYAVSAVPYTLTGKKMEVPLRRLLMGVPLARAASRDAMANPAALDDILDLAAQFQALLTARRDNGEEDQPIKFIWRNP
jgi:acetoacetyl-CoA synthetase